MSTNRIGAITAEFPELAAAGRIHFVGISGAGMLPLAALVARAGGRVSGSDRRPDPAREALGPLGVEVGPEGDPRRVEGAAAIVISAAVQSTHPELEAARSLGIPVLKRARALGEWVNRGRLFAVAGTHGKTTTSAMLTTVLAAAGADPTGVVGGRIPAWGGNLRPGRSDLYVVEADEFDRSFHTLRPSVAVVTSMEADHLEIYGSLEGVRASFQQFLAGLRPGGTVVACADDAGASGLLGGIDAHVVTYGFSPGAMLRGSDPVPDAGGGRCTIREGGVSRGEIRVPVPGMHNLRNALAAAAAARTLGVGWAAIRKGLAAYPGVHRRFERLGEAGGVSVLDDYAHHPTEVQAALTAARTLCDPGGRLVAVFQPHLFTRTRDFAPGFGAALALADEIWVTDIYPAREEPIEGVTGALVVEGARRAGGVVHWHPALEGLAEAVAGTLRPGDRCITLGAGSIETAGPRILEALRRRGGEP